jgi:antitoxin ParD1/3/4
MARITVNLPDDTMPRVRQEATARGFDTPADYLQSLIADDLRRRDQERLEAILLERVDRGQAVEMDDEDFRRIREEASARIAQRHSV